MAGYDIRHTFRDEARALRGMARQQRFAAVGAINEVLFQARAELQAEMQRQFPTVTPYVRRSVVVQRADKDKVHGLVQIDPLGAGGKGIPPEKVMAAEVYGGRRRAKRFEVAFQRAGLLPQGFGMVPARDLPRDAYGNVRPSFVVQLISYFRAFSEQGYRANMTDKRRRQLARRDRNERGFSRIRGVEYFVSRGRGEFTGRGSWRGGQQQHLPAGIWARSGIHGSDVRPVFLFVPLPRYPARYRFHEVADRVVREAFPRVFGRRLEAALATAR